MQPHPYTLQLYTLRDFFRIKEVLRATPSWVRQGDGGLCFDSEDSAARRGSKSALLQSALPRSA